MLKKLILLSSLSGALLSLMTQGFINQSWANSNGFFYIDELEGEVTIQHNSSGDFRPAFPGDPLDTNDKIQLRAGASAIVICSNGEPWEVPTGVISDIPESCSGGTVLVRSDSNRLKSRNIGNPNVPYVISPRGLLAEELSQIRWNKVADANSYNVQILEGSEEIWSQTTSDTEISYSAQLLEPGLGYEVVVETDNGISSRVEGVNGFRLLEESESQPILANAETIKQQELSQESKSLALAYLYLSQDLNSEAIAILENLIEAETQKTIVYRLLGDTYRQTGLSALAKEHYLNGLTLAEAEGNSPGIASIKFGLAEAEYALGNEDDAVTWMEQAQKEYVVLGDESNQQESGERIKYFLGEI
ncbi:MAG: tetratricopeptide repeat protein [Cyanobacteria bacterium P01_G01_bin.39]